MRKEEKERKRKKQRKLEGIWIGFCSKMFYVSFALIDTSHFFFFFLLSSFSFEKEKKFNPHSFEEVFLVTNKRLLKRKRERKRNKRESVFWTNDFQSKYKYTSSLVRFFRELEFGLTFFFLFSFSPPFYFSFSLSLLKGKRETKDEKEQQLESKWNEVFVLQIKLSSSSSLSLSSCFFLSRSLSLLSVGDLSNKIEWFGWIEKIEWEWMNERKKRKEPELSSNVCLNSTVNQFFSFLLFLSISLLLSLSLLNCQKINEKYEKERKRWEEKDEEKKIFEGMRMMKDEKWWSTRVHNISWHSSSFSLCSLLFLFAFYLSLSLSSLLFSLRKKKEILV